MGYGYGRRSAPDRRALEQEIGVELSLSFRNSSTGQGDESRLAQQEEQDRLPLLGPAPQPSTPQPPAPYPQLAPSFSPRIHRPLPVARLVHQVTPQVHPDNINTIKYQNGLLRNLWKVACKIRVWEM